MKRMLAKATTCFVATGLAVGLFATAASAHVTIDTLGQVEQGSFAKLGISVPNERSDAGTVGVKVQMPKDHPLSFVSVQPKPGWDVTTTTRTLDSPVEVEGESVSEVVDTVTWTATAGTQIGPGEFDVFWISAGPMPTDVTELSFPAIQTYSSGDEVAWIEATPASGEEPEHPVPTVQLVAAGAAAPDAPAADSSDDDDSSDTLAIIALIVGGLGLVAGVTAIVLTRRRSSGPVADTPAQ